MSNVITKAKSLILRKETKTAKQMMDAFSKAQPLLNRKEGGEKGYRSKLVYASTFFVIWFIMVP